jgi:hypothetical protein
MHGDRIADCNPSKVKAEIDTPLIPGGAWTEDKKASLAADGMWISFSRKIFLYIALWLGHVPPRADINNTVARPVWSVKDGFVSWCPRLEEGLASYHVWRHGGESSGLARG